MTTYMIQIGDEARAFPFYGTLRGAKSYATRQAEGVGRIFIGDEDGREICHRSRRERHDGSWFYGPWESAR